MLTVRQTCGKVDNMLGDAGVTTTATGVTKYKDGVYASYQAYVVGTGAVTATVVIECSNDTSGVGGTPQYWNSTPLGTITLTGTTSASDGFSSNTSWKWVRARVTAVTGTGAVVQAIMGV